VKRFDLTFLALVAAQAMHSIEEYIGRLYDVFPPARFVSSLIASDRRAGFMVFNVALVTFGLWCFLWPVRRRWAIAVPLGWLWVIIELINGIGHPLWTLAQGGYTPGVITAPALFALACYLGYQLLRDDAPAEPNHPHPRGT
jgi:hypothetical protein